MFESVLIYEPVIDGGLLAESILFYDKTFIAANTSMLVALMKSIGPDNLLGLIDENHISVTIIDDFLGTITRGSQISALEEHDFVAMEVTGDQTTKKLSREDKITRGILTVVNDARSARKIAKRLLDRVPHKKINLFPADPSGITGIARNDLYDNEYVRAAFQIIMECYVPKYLKKHELDIQIIKTDMGFSLLSNIDFEAATVEYQESAPNEQFTAAFALDHLFRARANMILSSHYMSELVTTKVLNDLVNLKNIRGC